MSKVKPAADEDIRIAAGKRFRSRIIINLVLIILGTAFIALFLYRMQIHTAFEKQKNTSQIAVWMAAYYLENNSNNAAELIESFHSGNQAVLEDISFLMSNGLSDRISLSDKASLSDAFGDITQRSGIDTLLLMSMDGRIAVSPDAALNDSDPVKTGLMSEQDRSNILKGTVNRDGGTEPVRVETADSTGKKDFYFYSMPYSLNGTEYRLVLGAEATKLDRQIESLRDISGVLSREAAGENGFLFAVDREAGTFAYFKNEGDDLTGQNISASGLSDAIYADEYSGLETIMGSDYYCFTKELDDRIVICAAARTESIRAGSMYALLWSVLAFVLIVLICLAYTIIVRNDFVRRSVRTEKILLKKDPEDPLYFDATVFKKVLPLMISSILVMFIISFYSQTLLELSESIDKSQAAVKEFSNKYESSMEDRNAVRSYYDNQLIAKAELIAYLMETDPSALNSKSDHYHFHYDKDGNKHFDKDEEGRRIRSVSSSDALQKLCKINGIESVYVFDEEGRTIGTNTDNWFFKVSRNKKDQSYPFRDVLDGVRDSLIQEPMTDDLGESSQFVGVGFNYYTREDENGNRVYVSKYDKGRPDGDGNSGIEKHRSMIQIGLNGEKSIQLRQAADFSNTLASYSLEDGYIRLYDTSDDHICLFSWIPEDEGKPASKLDVPKRAFDDAFFCGFSGHGPGGKFKIYQSNIYRCFETVINRGDVFQSRTVIALVTALFAFLLMVAMCASVSLTGRADEELFAAKTIRWKGNRFFTGDPENKLIMMIRMVAGLLVVGVVIAAAAEARNNYEGNSMLLFITSGAWDRGLNIFAFSRTVLVVLTVVLGIALLRIPLRLLPSMFGSRGETIGHLLISVLEYGGALAALFYCLYLFGVDSSKLIASAGLLTLIVGLGAQSLIKDIISGIFIVFEGEFHVGDIVTVNGCRGIVHDIGLRTTEVLGIDDEEGNLKILNNSEITEVLNMTYKPSWVSNRISIEYGQDIDYVEAVLRRELPELGRQNPYILEGPEYRGVEKFGDSGIELIFFTTCNERHVRKVRRAVNGGIIRIFYENGISVPFPVVTVTQLDTSGRRTIEDLPDETGEKTDRN